MEDLDKNEYVYLMTVRTHDSNRRDIDYNVHPFKTANDGKHAILNVITNNIKNCRDNIAYISYDIGSMSDAKTYGCARIEYKNGVSKTYNVIRCRIEEVKINYSSSSSKGVNSKLLSLFMFHESIIKVELHILN